MNLGKGVMHNLRCLAHGFYFIRMEMRTRMEGSEVRNIISAMAHGSSRTRAHNGDAPPPHHHSSIGFHHLRTFPYSLSPFSGPATLTITPMKLTMLLSASLRAATNRLFQNGSPSLV